MGRNGKGVYMDEEMRGKKGGEKLSRRWVEGE